MDTLRKLEEREETIEFTEGVISAKKKKEKTAKNETWKEINKSKTKKTATKMNYETGKTNANNNIKNGK